MGRLAGWFKIPWVRWGGLGLVLAIALIVYLVLSAGPGNDLYAEVRQGPFDVSVTVTGELQALHSEEINGPADEMRSKNFRLAEILIKDLVPEGTIVDSGDYVGLLDKQALSTQLKSLEDDVEKGEQQYIKTQLDTALTLRELRNSLLNLEFEVEDQRITLEQSKYEPPATVRKAQISLDKAERSLRQAQNNYKLKHQQAVASMREAALNLDKVKRNRESMFELLDRFTITAPRRGMVIYYREWEGKRRTVGSRITPWDPVVATLPDLSVLVSKTYVNEVDVSRVKVGQSVEVGADAFPDWHYTGRVIQVANVGEQVQGNDARVFEVLVQLDGTDSILRPSMTTSNRILIQHLDSALYCPLECIHTLDSIQVVYTADGQRKEVKVGVSNDTDAVLLGGLSVGERLYLSMPEHPERFTPISLKQ